MSQEDYMQRALDLAVLGKGSVSPNPLVGAVVVHQQRIIGEGYHQQFGGPHAEVNAINQVKDKHLLAASTVYVTLEPCSHYGKTPPCADLLVQSGVKHVVVGMVDPNPIVAGRGIAYLQQHGVQVECGILQAQCEQLNKRFITFHQKHRPYILLKWAQTSDGFIAPDKAQYSEEAFQQKKIITGELAHLFTHQCRATEDAIMVGTNTVVNDNPQLNVRKWKGRNPVRIVLDLTNRIPKQSHVFDGTQRTIVFSYQVPENAPAPVTFITLNPQQAIVPQILAHLHQLQIQSVIVEGGTKLLQTFIEATCWDEAHVFTAPTLLHSGVKAPEFYYPIAQSVQLAQDQLHIYYSS